MKVYFVESDLAFQSLSSDEFKKVFPLMNTSAAESFGDIEFPEFYVHDSKKIRGNFFNIGKGIVFDDAAHSELGSIVESAGELFPVEVEQIGTLQYLNVLETNDSLDHDKSIWRDEEDNEKYVLLKYAFQPEKLRSNSGLFRIAENRYSKPLAVTGSPLQKGDFYAQYHASGLTGLSFRLLWSDED